MVRNHSFRDGAIRAEGNKGGPGRLDARIRRARSGEAAASLAVQILLVELSDIFNNVSWCAEGRFSLFDGKEGVRAASSVLPVGGPG